MSQSTCIHTADRPDASRPGHGSRSNLRPVAWAGLALVALALAACSPAPPKLAPEGRVERGVASWYGPDFHGRRTASGEPYDMHALTAAHLSLPFDTLVEVRNLENGKVTRVRINDRGPFRRGRIIDLSYAAAGELDMVPGGTARVELLALGRAQFAEPRYTVQVGAFQELTRAEGLVHDMCPRFPEAEVHSDGAWHRVQIGRFNNRELAEGLQQKLLAQGLAALVVAIP